MYTVTNNDELNKVIFENKDKLILLYFGATWCGPCQQLKENFKNESMMSQYDKLCVIYLDVDLDSFNNLCDIYEVEALPTQWFVLFKDFSMERIHKITGFNWGELHNTYINSLELLDNSENNSSENNSENTDNNKENNTTETNESISSDNLS